MEKKTRRAYSTEFKRDGAELATQPGQTVAGVVRDLGIRPGLLGRWKREPKYQGEQAFIGQGVARDQELMRLRRELAQVKKERDFPKSAPVYFASDAK